MSAGYRGPKRVRIVMMDSHFLYLPLYIAEHLDFFGLLPSGVKCELEVAEPATDRRAYELLMDQDAADAREVLFAVCDPVEVFLEPQLHGSLARVLCAIITSRAFWAIDRGTLRINEPRDIGKYQQIIAYGEGTTSYRLARELLKAAGRTDDELNAAIRPTTVFEEFDVLRRSAPGTIALSPNVLAMEKLVAEREFRREFSLAQARDYDQVLTTALLTTATTASRHEPLVRGLVNALQRAVVLVRSESAEVIEYAERRWGEAYGKENVAKALRRANEEKLFPATLEIRESHWDAAVRSARASDSREYGEIAERASRTFRECVGSCSHFAADAFTGLMSDIREPDEAADWRKRVSTMLRAASWIVAAGLLVLAWQETLPLIRENALLKVLHGLFFVALAIAAGLGAYDWHRYKKWAGSITGGALVVEALVVDLVDLIP